MSFTVGKLRVLIATTNGPVEVQLLTEEDAAIGRCVACIGGTTETADIASAYHAFVVRPTGIIESRFGHSCYRLDVSGRIDAGSSWQLGVLAAHALLASGRLAQENDDADAILWATGSVRPVDLTVGGVSHVPEKLENSLPRLKQEFAARRPVLLAIPEANAREASTAASAELRKLGAKLVTVAHAQSMFDALGMKLPGPPVKAAAAVKPPTPAPAAPAGASTAPKPKRGIITWIAAAVAIVIVSAIFTNFPFTVVPRPTPAPRLTNTAPATSATPTAEPASRTDPRNAELKQPELVPEKIPFVAASDRQRIRDEYLPAPDYKAIAINMYDSYFVSGLASQEAANKQAVANCEGAQRPRTSEASLSEIEHRCELFASGSTIVSPPKDIPMPPLPWTQPSIQRPLVASEVPTVGQDIKDIVEHRYRRQPETKALILGPKGEIFRQAGESDPNEAMRRGLERCGYLNKTPCLVIAVGDNFVNAIPTLAKAVGLFRPDDLVGVLAEERAFIARRLAASSGGWQAVAIGAAQHAGVEIDAASERGAIEGALANCAMYDHDCRVMAIGWFLVQAPPGPLAPLPSASPPATAAPPPPIAIAPPSASNQPSTVTAAPQRPSDTPPLAKTAQPSSSVPPAASVPPAFRPAPAVRPTKQTDFER